jgi:hypothetical protein
MWISQYVWYTGDSRTFFVTLSGSNLMNYYKLSFDLINNHNFSLTELNGMLPWEREVYVNLLINDITEKNSKAENKQMQ